VEKYSQANANDMQNLDNPTESENITQRLFEEEYQESRDALVLEWLGWVIKLNACFLLAVVIVYLLVKMYTQVGGFSYCYCH
jgi:hypothetical protein